MIECLYQRDKLKLIYILINIINCWHSKLKFMISKRFCILIWYWLLVRAGTFVNQLCSLNLEAFIVPELFPFNIEIPFRLADLAKTGFSILLLTGALSPRTSDPLLVAYLSLDGCGSSFLFLQYFRTVFVRVCAGACNEVIAPFMLERAVLEPD